METRAASITACLAAAFAACAAFGSEWTIARYTESMDVIRNPGQGWTSGTKWQFVRKDPDVNYGQVYIRTSWTALEPKEGQYNWKELDGMLKVAENQGLPLSLRIMCACIKAKAPSTPQWVFDKGAKGDKIVIQLEDKGQTNDVTQISPRFDDPIFMREHKRFIEALAKRYDGDPRIAGIDIGSYGHWGEWHCHGLPPDTNRYMTAVPPEKRPHTKPLVYPFEIRRQYADWYLDNFKKTPLVFMTDDWETLKYAIGEAGPSRVGLRRDGVGSPWHATRWIGNPPYDQIPKMGEVWKDRPVWFEFFGHAPDMVKKGWDVPAAIDFMLTNHVTVVNTIPFSPWELKDFDPDLFKQLKKLDLYAGARLVPKKGAVKRFGKAVAVALSGENKGVARIHLPYSLQAVVTGPNGQELFAADLAADPRSWLPGPFKFAEKIELPQSADVEGARISFRLRHRPGVLRNFRFAAKETAPDGSLPIGPIPDGE